MKSHPLARALAVASIGAATLVASPAVDAAVSPTAPVVINEVYGAGGNNGAVLSHDFVELYNPGTSAVSLAGWSVQYAASAGTNWSGVIPLGGTIEPGGYYLVQAGTNNATVGAPLPPADASGGANFSATNGNVALASQATALSCQTTACQTDAAVVDLVGFGTGQAFAGTAAPSPSASTSIGRYAASANTINNGDDFEVFDPPTPDAQNPAPPDPTDPVAASVADIQGSVGTTPLDGQLVTVDGVVTTMITSGDALNGFYIQDEGDGDSATSDGVYVFCGGNCPAGLVAGASVEVTGTAGEFNGQTQVNANAAGATAVGTSGNPLPAPVPVTLPAAGSTEAADTFEATEGMVATIPGALAVSEYFELARFGQLVLTAGGRPDQFTDANPPSIGGYEEFLDTLATTRIVLDDASNDQNDPVVPNTPATDETYAWPLGGLSETNRIRGGDTVTDLTGVLDWSFGAWRVRPVDGIGITFDPNGPSAELADVGGDLRVASFNVLNYFTTVDTTASDNAGDCGPSTAPGQDCRGADSVAELDVQREKIVAAITEIDPAVAGLIEIQNDAGAATDDLVAGLNAATAPGTYAAVDTGEIGTDAIKQAFVYQPGLVTPVGEPAILDSSVDPTYIDTANRPALVQTFEEVASGEQFTVAVNHLKSKGSACTGDADALDGAGNCNGTRTAAAAALANFLADHAEATGVEDTLIIGDLNAYRMETPITTLTGAGYTDLVAQFEGDDAYSYVFDGQLGYLDHALANAALAPKVTGATTWHINADEVPVFDYNDNVGDAGEASFERESWALDIDDRTALRSSDHDPVVVGLDLDGDAEDQPLRLTLLHNNDGESALLPNATTGIGGIGRFSTIVEDLRTQAAAEPGNADSLLVSSGDNFLAGLALQASLENYDGDTDYSNDGPFYDALALDHLGYDASAVGNHEFDFGPNVLGYFMSEFDTSNIRFVSANLDVTGDAALEQFVDASPGEAGTLVEWTRAEAGGRRVAIVGATTPLLPTISSPGPNVTVDPDVLGAVQGAIDEATADGTEVVILISHLQNIAEDQALIAELSGIDIAVAGGGDELLANDDDILLPGSTTPYGPYPIVQEAADGNDVPIVTTQGSYSYVGRLIVDIDADGEVTAVDGRSGPVRNATEDGVVPDPWVVDNVEAPVQAYIDDLATQVVAHTEPALDGRRPIIRTQETNLGSFFADALREAATLADDRFGATNPTVALQNSGGIRNESVIGPDVDVTAQDVFTIAPFENFLSYVPDVTPEKLKELMERSVSAGLVNGALAAEGRFGQISGMNIVYDPTRQAQVIDAADPLNVVVVTPGERVRQLTLTLDPDDPADDIVVVRNGQVVSGAPNVDLAGNSFTIAANGDAYPFNLDPSEIVNLGTTYRQALQDKFVREGTVTAAEYPEGGLGRITIGGDVPVEPDLRVDDAALTFPRRLPGTAVVTGGVDDTYARCPQLGLTVDGTEVVDVRTFNLFGVCVGLGRGGLVTFDRNSSDFAVLGGLPRGFTVADADVDFELTLDDTSYAATVPGTLTATRWTAN